MVGVLNVKMHASLPPNTLLFQSPLCGLGESSPCLSSEYRFKPTGNKCEHKIGHQSQLQHLNARSGNMHACILYASPHGLYAADTYKEDILKLQLFSGI